MLLPFVRLALMNLVLAGLWAGDPPWLGAWRDDKDGALLVFEADRLIIRNPDGSTHFACAAYSPDGDVWARVSGGRLRLKVSVVGDALAFQQIGGESGTYKRLARVPEGLIPAPMTIPEPKAIDPARIKAIKAEAGKRLKQDQAVRKNQAKGKDMGKVDADNTAWLKTIIAEVGWPDAKRFGKETASAMFLFVQHSGDMPLMLGALPCIERDLKAKVCDPQDYALLYDRVQMHLGRPQRYGSQVVPDEGGQVVWLLEDKAKVEEIRAGIGLFPLQLYLQIFAQQGAKVGFMEQIRFAD